MYHWTKTSEVPDLTVLKRAKCEDKTHLAGIIESKQTEEDRNRIKIYAMLKKSVFDAQYVPPTGKIVSTGTHIRYVGPEGIYIAKRGQRLGKLCKVG